MPANAREQRKSANRLGQLDELSKIVCLRFSGAHRTRRCGVSRTRSAEPYRTLVLRHEIVRARCTLVSHFSRRRKTAHTDEVLRCSGEFYTIARLCAWRLIRAERSPTAFLCAT